MLNSAKGLDQVRGQRIHGSVDHIRKETLKILKVNKKRFVGSVDRRNEFEAGIYLANMLASEDVET